MNKLQIDFENCFGIGKLEHEFSFDNTQTCLIYAPNGTMKTSFAKTFSFISQEKRPEDNIFKDRLTKCEILSDSNPLLPPRILVINTDNLEYDSTQRVSKFIASRDLKAKYDDILSDLEIKKHDFIRKLMRVSRSTDCECEILDAFKHNDITSFYEVLLHIDLNSNTEKYDFKYNDVFDKNGKVKIFLDRHKIPLENYISKYKDLLQNSSFFRMSENSFGTYQAKEILSSVKDNSFFEAGHALQLDDGGKVCSYKELENLINSQINTIINDVDLKEAFNKIDKALDANTELRAFKKILEKNNLILVKLHNYEDFKKEIWKNYLLEIKSEYDDLIKLYLDKKHEIEQIIDSANKESESWKKVINIFNQRFHVPFVLELQNQKDIILNDNTPIINFMYEENEQQLRLENKKQLFDVLSKGEQRAFFILQMLFEVEARRTESDISLIILDDIADSFDYKNKYAIIEYIRELNHDPKFRIIVLTHNFDFYRTVSSRVLNNKNMYMATKDVTNRKIILNKGGYTKSIINYFIKNLNDKVIFVSFIPFLRNIIEYMHGENLDFLLLTSCLHMKSDTKSITFDDILQVAKNYSSRIEIQSLPFANEKVYDTLINICHSLTTDANIDEIKLENKILLSISIRLKAEEYIISQIQPLPVISSNQTFELIKLYKQKYESNNSKLKILEKVNLMTPENIHVNSFMYEPLLDMSVNHLIDLYQEVKSL